MADFVPPPGPPPPKVPEGWKAQWNDQYNEWFYVNIHTKQSQWEKPAEPAYPSSHVTAPPDEPPSYSSGKAFDKTSDQKGNPYETASSTPTVDDDARLAAQLQAEENARSRDAMHDYANTSIPQQSYGQQTPYASPAYGQAPQQAELPPREQKKGLFSKLLGGTKPHSASYGQPAYNHPPQGSGYGNYPPQGYGGYGQYGQPGYGGYPPGGGYGYRPPQRSGGLGTAGGAALGLGGGLLGGVLLGEALEGGMGGNDYNQGYEAGQDNANGGDYGGDDGGGDMGGGGDF